MGRTRLSRLTKKQLIDCIADLCDREVLQWEQVDEVLDEQLGEGASVLKVKQKVRLSQEYVSENMSKAIEVLDKIEDQELMISAYWYEDYSEGYWNSTEICEYEDTDGVMEMLVPIVKLAGDCTKDGWYEEALSLYDRLLDMEIYADDELDGTLVGLAEIVEGQLLKLDLKEICLNTLYCDYQIRDKESRVEDIHSYFDYGLFRNIHIQDMFRVGKEQPEGEEEFLEEWIQYLLDRENDIDSRLLKEALAYSSDADGIAELAEKHYKCHPALYLYAAEEYITRRDYGKALETGRAAMEKLSYKLRIRSQIAKKAAEAAEATGDMEQKYSYLYEAFRSDSNVSNFLVLFEDNAVAERYGVNCRKLLPGRYSDMSVGLHMKYKEKETNEIWEYTYNELLFFMGEFETVKRKCKNPPDSLGWSSSFIKMGISLFLLYLYEGKNTRNEKSVRNIADSLARSQQMEEGPFLEMFAKWKKYYPMEQAEKKKVLEWAEGIIVKRVDAIVGGQHRGQYAEVAVLLGAVAEIRESWGEKGAKRSLRQEYKAKYPRHSSFQGELNTYLGVLKK